MCDICRQVPCAARCPNSPEPRAIFVCSGCDQDIYEGDYVYHIMGEQFCQRCIDNAREEAEYEPYEDEEMDFDIGKLLFP